MVGRWAGFALGWGRLQPTRRTEFRLLLDTIWGYHERQFYIEMRVLSWPCCLDLLYVLEAAKRR